MNTRRLLASLFSVVSALWAVACGGGSGTTITPPPPNVGFTASNLQGQYAFSMSGTTVDSSTLSAVPFTRIGSFIADGKGNITGGVEDVNLNFVGLGSQRLTFTGGTYTVGSDGRGTLNVTSSGTNGGSLTFVITLSSSSSGYIVDMPTDGGSTASGNFVLQNSASFTLGGISGGYAFDFSGADGSGNPESFVGQMTSNGTGLFASAVVDDNDGGLINGGNGGGVASSGSYSTDSLNPNDLSSFGRGTFTLAGAITGVFYIVGPNQVKFMETSTGGSLAGDAFLQTNVPTTTAGISGGFVYVMGGSGVASAGITGPITRGGRLSASSGTLSNILVDNNNSGQKLSLTGTSGTYTLDPSGDGRGTITFTASGQTNPFTYVFYLISPTQAVVQDQSAGIVADGSMLAQGGSSVSNSSLAGNYAINWSGVTSTNTGVSEEDLIGETAIASGNLTGNIDLNEFASGFQFTSVPLTGTLALSGDGTGHNTLTINLATNPANDGIKAFAYVANNNTVLIMTTQNVRVTAGVLTPQNP